MHHFILAAAHQTTATFLTTAMVLTSENNSAVDWTIYNTGILLSQSLAITFSIMGYDSLKNESHSCCSCNLFTKLFNLCKKRNNSNDGPAETISDLELGQNRATALSA